MSRIQEPAEHSRIDAVTSSAKIWKGFKWLAECPGQESGGRRIFGIFTYALGIMASVTFVVVMFQGSQSAYVDYKSEGGDSSEAALHRVPDFVACPRLRTGDRKKFKVEMNPETLNATGMTEEDQDFFSQIHYEDCREDGCDLSRLRTPCEGTRFEVYCQRLEKFIETDSFFPTFTVAEYWARQKPLLLIDTVVTANQMAAISIMLEKEKGRWTLEILWLGLMYAGYGPVGDILDEKVKNLEYKVGLECHYYLLDATGSIDESIEVMKIQRHTTKTVWIGKSLCLVQMGSALPQMRMPFFGCKAFWSDREFRFPGIKWEKLRTKAMDPFRYWMGNLGTTTLKESEFYLSHYESEYQKTTEKGKVLSGVVHYKMVSVKDQADQKAVCSPQPAIRGMKIPCEGTQNRPEVWFYEFAPQNRTMQTVWIYGKTKVTLERKATFSLYTKFQVGAGIFGCIVGMSMAQIMEAILIFTRRSFKERGLQAIRRIRLMTILLLIAGSVSLTAFDMTEYVRNRYSTVFTEESSELEIPVVKICPDEYIEVGFLNVTKMYELNVSLQLFGYLKYAGLLRYPTTQLIFKIEEHENGTVGSRVPEWMIRNFKPKPPVYSKCGEHHQCLEYPNLRFLNHYLPDPRYEPMIYGETRQFLHEMAEEAKSLRVKLRLRPEATIVEIMNALHLDPTELFRNCRVGGIDIPDCGKYATYTMYARRQVCLGLRIPTSAVGEKREYGFEKGFSLKFDHAQYHLHSDQYSYYGPGVDEERSANREDGLCYNKDTQISEKSRALGYHPGHCSAGAGWSLKIQLPSPTTSELEYRLRPTLRPPVSFVADVQTAFRYNDLRKNCRARTSTRVCTYPNEELATVLRALHFEAKCSCSYCYGSETEDVQKTIDTVSLILGKKSHCCSDTEFYQCYAKTLEAVDWVRLKSDYFAFLKNLGSGLQPERNIVKARKHVNGDPAFKQLRNFIYSVPQLTAKLGLDHADSVKIKSLLSHQFRNSFSNESIESLVSYAKACYEEPCKVETLDLLNIQPRPHAENTSDITIFYSTNTAYGMEIIDLLDPVQLIATLLAGYSATFGISIIGLIELVTVFVRNWRSKSRSTLASQTGRQHIMKYLTSFVSFRSSKTSPEDRNASDGAKRQEGEVDVELETNSEIHEVASGEIIPIPEKSGRRINAEVEVIEEDKVASENLGSSGILLLVTLLIALLLASKFLIFYFFTTFTNTSYDGRVAEPINYEYPSIVICVERKELVEPLLRSLERSECTTSNEDTKSCAEVFETFFRNREQRFCILMDNTGKFARGNEDSDDLIMKVPDDFPSVIIGAVSLNKTSLERIYPFFEWEDQDAEISYTISLRESEEAKCVSRIATKPCEKCPQKPETVLSPSICCFGSKNTEPAITPSRTCHQYRFSSRISTLQKESLDDRRKLSVKLGDRNMMVYSIKQKYSFVYYLSIVGGFIGSFVELTILNITAAFALAVHRLVQHFLVSS